MSGKIEDTVLNFQKFQSLIFDKNTSPNLLFVESEKIINQLHESSVLIEKKFEDISDKLTTHLNTGRFQK